MAAVAIASGAIAAAPVLHWESLPSIPDREGFASPFAGSNGGALIVAGGANFPDKRPWEGGTKKWYDDVFVLPAPNQPWKTGFKLPRPVAYGVSVNTPDGIICIGGGNATQHFKDVFRLSWDGTTIHATPLADLPKPCALMCGAVVEKTIYITGGIERPDAVECLNTFWSLDFTDAKAQWKELEPPPQSPARMLSVAAGAGGSFYRFTGARLFPSPEGKPVREYLHDAWRFTPGQGWKQLTDIPRAAVAAASPAPVSPRGRILVISGDDGLNIHFKPETQHPGFPRNVLAYDPAADKWDDIGPVPFSRGTVPVAPWGDRIVIPNGEARPGYRSPEVWSLRIDD
jgi:N-acetylneuraminic acid mutarotase